MFGPALSFACLAESVVLFPTTSLTLKKLYQGSKSLFAYLLIAFTLGYGFSKLVYFINNLFPKGTVQEPTGYVFITNYYFYFLLSLQCWIFGNKYLWSGVLCSQEATCLSLNCVKWMGWTGGLCYALLMISCWCILMATFPGYIDLAKLQEWYFNTFSPISQWSSIIWAVFNIVSTMLTIVGIYKIIKTMEELERNNASIKTN